MPASQKSLRTLSNFKSQGFPTAWRWLGLLPLTFFLARLGYFMVHGGVSQILWLCHLSNLTLAIGLLFNRPVWVGISAYWLVLGIPFWILDVLGFGMEGLTSLATHGGGTILALCALFKVRSVRPIWTYAFGWYLFLQAVSRLFTPPELNINAAHAVYRGWESYFSDYFWYWLLITAAAGLSVYLLDLFVVLLMQRLRKAGSNEVSSLG